MTLCIHCASKGLYRSSGLLVVQRLLAMDHKGQTDRRCPTCQALVDNTGRALAQGRYRHPSLTADAAVIHWVGQQGASEEKKRPQVLMIRRGGATFHGYLAFPGGFVEYNEDPKDACLRELREETGLIGENPRLVGLYGDPKRDPRGHTVSAFYMVEVADISALQAGDDAAHAAFYEIEDLKKEKLAFDHNILLTDLEAFLQRNA